MDKESLKNQIAKIENRLSSSIEFPKSLTWFNSEPLSIEKDLQGQLVILDFWTYCCINCIHIIALLAKLEEKYKNYPATFIGIHSPKFTNEKNDEAVKNAIKRYGISHPVANDAKMVLWNQVQIRAWPTLLILSPQGKPLFQLTGETEAAMLDSVIEAAIEYYKLQKTSKPISKEKKASSSLYFPSKLFMDKESKQLFVADSSHHQIVSISEDAKQLYTIGSPQSGFKDGSFEEAQFCRPQGLFYKKPYLYVADTENHAIREINLEEKQVKTIVGTGIQGHDRAGGLTGTKQPISSPWALSLINNTLFIAMAGSHQIWTYDLITKLAKSYSGTGQELQKDDSNLELAAWAQPSSLTYHDRMLYIADSESSSIRAIDIENQSTMTIAGGDPIYTYNLFAYGDHEGIGISARLQHPLDLLWAEPLNALIIADTYNHRLKKLDPHTKEVENFVGSGKMGFLDGEGAEAMFFEPSGLSLSSDKKTLYVSDTNNHAIRQVNLKTKKVSTFYA